MRLIKRHITIRFVLSSILLCAFPFIVFAQQQVVFNGDYMVINGGGGAPAHTAATPIYLVVDNPSPTALVDTNGTGWLISESEYNQVAWNIGANTGNYVVPFGDTTLNYIPLTVNITSGGDVNGSLRLATYNDPTWDDQNYMPRDVTNMKGNTTPDNSAKVVDRFWIIDAEKYASKPTTDLTFTYMKSEVTATGNAITEANLFAQRFDSTINNWADWYGTWGTDNSVLSTVNSGNVTPANLYRSWVLADRTSPLGPTPITVQPRSDTICAITDTSFTVVDTGVGMTFQWEVNNGTGFTNVVNGGVYSGATTPTLTITGATAGMSGYTYYCIVGNGMVLSDTITLTVLPPPNVSVIPASTAICLGSNALLSASGASTYVWSPSSSLSCSTCTSPNASPTTTTTYVVMGTNAAGCKDSATVLVTVDSVPKISISGPQKICEGLSTNLTASGGTSYSWSPAAGLSNSNVFNPTASPAANTTYTVTVMNGPCVAKDSVFVFVNPAPVGTSATTDATIDIGNSAPLTATVTSGDTYIWQPSATLNCDTCPNPTATPSVTTTYSLIVTDSEGCTITDTVTITVEDLCQNVFVPGAFSPNGDGHNDVLYVRGNCIIEMDFIVYDRWGNKVFESNDPHMGWDGRYNGQMMNTASFGYYLKAKLFNGTTVEKKGNVGLVR
jgi:gliding motility-associated-like protein